MSAEPATVLTKSRRVAVVGFSTNPDKAAHYVPVALHNRGFQIFPVHPTAEAIAGLTAYPSLADVPQPIDLVVVFRPAAEAADVAVAAVEAGARGIWLQQGIVSPEAEMIAADAGLSFIEDRCAMIEANRNDVRHEAA